MQLQQAFSLWYESYSRTVGSHTSSETQRKFNEVIPLSLKNTDINEIKPVQILKLSEQVAEQSTYYAKRIVADLVRIYNYATVILEVTDKNPAYALKIGGYVPTHKVVGYKFVNIVDVPKMLRKIDYNTVKNRSSTMAFWTIVYTALRRSEVVNARKSEFDFDNLLWTIPSKRMKISSNGDHVVPLSIQLAIELQAFFKSNSSEYAFPSKRTNGAINPIACYHILEKVGYGGKQTLHGFRKIFSTHAHNNNFSIDSIELSLHHEIKGVRGVYNHADMLEERVKLMQWYADEIDKMRGIR